MTYKRSESKLDKVTWSTDPIKSQVQYWAQDLHSVIKKTADDRCDITIYDRFTKINMGSFDSKPIHIQKAETTIYTDGSKTDRGVGAGSITKKEYILNKYTCQTRQQYFKLKLKQ